MLKTCAKAIKRLDFSLNIVYFQSMPKYDSVRKAKRNSLIVAQHIKHPGLSYEELGVPFGVTKQRVHQILNSKDCSTCSHRVEAYCDCREIIDMETRQGKCGDWSPIDELA